MSGIDRAVAAEVEDEVRRYVAGYCGALWNYVTTGEPIDYDALDFWEFPMLMISGAGDACSVTFWSRSGFDEMVRPGYEHYYQDGWDGRVEVHSAKASLVGPSFSVVETTGSRYRADGSVNSSWSCLYVLRRTARGWKHIAVDAALPPRSVSDWGNWLESVAPEDRA